jgi:hypothetical protein
MIAGDVIEALGPATCALEALEVAYYIGGSIAGSAHGIARATIDVDLVVDLRPAKCDEFVCLLGSDYYVDAGRVRDAVSRRTSFNIIHLPTMVKLDVFVLKDEPFHRESFARARPRRLDSAAGSRTFPMASAEDVVLHKLAWYRSGGEVSARQWKDVLGILKVQSTHLDQEYLRNWAQTLGLSKLLERAVSDAGER